ncbi:MAG: FAD-dependent oxidoreductase, partial [Opitutaceae bacterium]|nr:FAD-dependent oxidoreductase [Opitutaceae bacterium]
MSNLKTHELTCDILVAGGGPAGVPCALAAARNGANVILCQDRPVLGGNASSEVRMHIVGANGGMEGIPMESEVRESGIIEEIRLEQALHNPQRSPSMMDLTLYDLCRIEPNLTLFLNTTVTEVLTSGKRTTQVIAERQSTEDRFEITAETFIDCTGDGRVGAEAGAAFIHGREGKEVYGESLAPDLSDKKTLGSSLLFMAKRHDNPMPFKAPTWARHVTAEDLKLRPYASAGSDLDLDYGYWWAEWGGCLDTLKDNEEIRDELLSIFFGVWDFVKNRSGVDADNWALEWFGFLPGKRESRRFIGLHTLTEQDLVESKHFDDAIAYGGWPIDIHPPEGVDAPDKPPCEQTWIPYLFSIPLRSCLTKDIENLMFAGRNISASHVAFASTRVMATCAVVGQGVGTVAALASEKKVTPLQICEDSTLMNRVQQTLLKNDAYLIGIKNNDEKDLARSASISASSESAICSS